MHVGAMMCSGVVAYSELQSACPLHLLQADGGSGGAGQVRMSTPSERSNLATSASAPVLCALLPQASQSRREFLATNNYLHAWRFLQAGGNGANGLDRGSQEHVQCDSSRW